MEEHLTRKWIPKEMSCLPHKIALIYPRKRERKSMAHLREAFFAPVAKLHHIMSSWHRQYSLDFFMTFDNNNKSAFFIDTHSLIAI